MLWFYLHCVVYFKKVIWEICWLKIQYNVESIFSFPLNYFAQIQLLYMFYNFLSPAYTTYYFSHYITNIRLNQELRKNNEENACLVNVIFYFKYYVPKCHYFTNDVLLSIINHTLKQKSSNNNVYLNFFLNFFDAKCLEKFSD